MAITPEARPHRGGAREEQVRTLFSEIAPRYDLLNHVLSLNVDRRWRKVAVDRLDLREGATGLQKDATGLRKDATGLQKDATGLQKDASGLRVLDLCAGTFDLSLEVVRRAGFRGRVAATDFAAPMLYEGLAKVADEPVDPVCGDALRLPFGDESFDRAMVAFGVRNLADLDRGMAELVRILRPGGRVVVLEFTTPPNRLMRGLYLFYFHRILPLIGRIVSGHPWAYTYLPESVKEFPDPAGLATRMERAGFSSVHWSYLTGGVAAVHVGVKGQEE